MTPAAPVKSPYIFFGGKSHIAPVIWQALGDCPNTVEPFFGSGAVLLGRPHPPKTETVNDADCHIVNLWRALQRDPGGLAALLDEPVNEITQHAFHLWLLEPGRRKGFEDRLICDPDYFDLSRAARWLYGINTWIGSGWCSGYGPWQRVEEGEGHPQLRQVRENGHGITRRLSSVGAMGCGIRRQRLHLGDTGNGIHAPSTRGAALLTWFTTLQARLRYVRVCCGDWTRVLGPNVTWRHGLTGIVLDPPYQTEERDDVYTTDTPHIAQDVRQWALANGDNPLLRIVLCGYETPTYTMPDTWEKIPWQTNSGYGNQGQGRGRANRTREVLWCSPACLKIADAAGKQIPLFA